MRAHQSCFYWAAAPARAIIIAGLLLALSAYDWPQFGFNSLHSADNTLETGITPANVHTLSQIFRVLLPGVTDSRADGAPVFLFGGLTSAGRKNLVFVTTHDGSIIALDWRTGAMVWKHQNGPGSCKINNGSTTCYTTSSPVIDPNRQFVYSYGLDGYVHKYQVGDGSEILTSTWPETATLKPWDEKGSSALSVATAASSVSYLYVTNGGYPGDQGDYQGHVTAINLATGEQRVFNAMCSDHAVHFTEPPMPGTHCPDVQSAIWARPGVVYDPDTNRIYMATGNGTYDPANHYWGDTVFALNPDGTGAGVAGSPLDSYTPVNFDFLDSSDQDLGSTAPAILPNTSKYPHLAVQGGKDQMLRLINLDNMSGQGAPGLTGGEVFSMSVPQGGEVLTMPAVWINPSDHSTWVFVATGNGLSALQLQIGGGGNPSLVKRWQIGTGGTSPIVADGVLYMAGGGAIYAFDPVSNSELWHDASIGGTHWESPVVADGLLYITDESGQLTAYTPGGVVPAPLSNIFLPMARR